MEAELILIGVALLSPGAVFLLAWDSIQAKKDRKLQHFLLLSIVISSMIWSGILPFSSLNPTLLFDEAGRFSTVAALGTENILLYFLLAMILGLLGGVCSICFHSAKVQNFFAKHTGRSVNGSNWYGIARDSTDQWVRFYTKAGQCWQGTVYSISDNHADGFVLLGKPSFYGEIGWVSTEVDRVVFRLEDIDYWMFGCYDSTTNKGEEDGRKIGLGEERARGNDEANKASKS